MDVTRQILGAYCERTDAAFWSEPVNAVTNAAFLIAGVAGLMIAARENRLDGPVLWLSVNVLIIGVGSFLFHTFATVWAVIADTGPIGLFILSYFAISMNRFAGVAWRRATLLTLGFLLAMGAVSTGLRYTVGPYIGGSQSYLPALLGLLAVGLWLHRVRLHPAGLWLIAAAAVFAVSLTFRTLDKPLCDLVPVGLHFLWHILNGCLLFILIWAVIRHGRMPGREGGHPA